MISTAEELNTLCDQIRHDVLHSGKSEAFITLDTEFIRGPDNNHRLCLIQIASHMRSEIIDVMTIGYHQHLQDLLYDDCIRKVLHGCDQDIDTLARSNFFMRNVYDTQIGELSISTQKTASYEHLVQTYLKKSLKKTCKTSDWSKRPLTEEQKQYALNDVIPLRAIYKQQISKLREQNRETWVIDEVNNRLSVYMKTTEDTILAPFAGCLHDYQDDAIERLKKLAAWRQQKAQSEDKPDHFILRNDVLLSVAKCGQNRITQLRKLKKSKHGILKEFIKHASSVCSGYHPAQDTLQDHGNSAVVDFLKLVLDYCSQKYSVNKTLIAVSEDLYALVNGGTHSWKCSHGWRYEVFGRYVELALAGKMRIKLDNNKLEASFE